MSWFTPCVVEEPQGYRACIKAIEGGRTLFRLFSPVLRAYLHDAEQDGVLEAQRLAEGQNSAFVESVTA